MTAEAAFEKLKLPVSMLESRLFKRGGFLAVRGLLPPGVIDELREDFYQQLPKAKRSEWTGRNEADWRGGEPSRALASVCCGPVEYAVFGSAPMARVISDLCGLDLEATGAGTYSYYSQPGDHLALHRDIVRCDIAVITCLEEEGPPGARLRAYPDGALLPLSAVLEAPGRTVDIVLAPGDTAVLAGGVVPHEVTSLGRGQKRAVVITCFRWKP